MKILKLLVPTCLVIAIAVSLYFFFFSRSLSFPDFDKVSYSFQIGQDNFSELEKAEFDKIKEVCSKGRGFLHEFYSKPEIVLKFEKENKEPSYISLFLKEGFLFQDDYLAAWYDRMRGYPSYCYVLSDQQKKYLADFINNKKIKS